MKNHLPILFLFLFCLASLAHGQKIFVKAGDLTRGMSNQNGYKDYAPLSSFQVGIQAETSWTKGGGAAVGKPNPLEIEFTKFMDGFSNRLNLLIATGKSIPKMEIVWLAETDRGGALEVAHKVELESVFITEVMNSTAEGCSSCFAIAESYKVVYKTIKRTIYRQDERDGSFDVESVFTWDIPAGTAGVN